MRSLRFILLLTGLFSLNSLTGFSQAFLPKKGARIALIGNTFIDRMQYYNHFEGLLYKNYPNHQLVIRNLGWSADEPALQPRPLNFGDIHTHLATQKADIIMMSFGMSESFKGKAGVAQFEKELTAFITDLRKHKYNKVSAPQLVLISPIAHEDIGGYYPKPDLQNENLLLYTATMKKVATKMAVKFLDLYTPSMVAMKSAKKANLTINGIHLTDDGYKQAAEWMAKGLGLKISSLEKNKNWQYVIDQKNLQFFYRWRAVNGEYIYGRRKKPFGVKNYPEEMEKLDWMVGELDKIIWEMTNNPNTKGYEKAVSITDEGSKKPEEAPEHGHHQMPATTEKKAYPATIDQFVIPSGYEINLFASEQDFPLEKPVNMTFDSKGRLWVALIPSYPHYFPGQKPNDRIVILEDTNGDGRADKHTVFADKLYLPLSFEFWNGGLLVSAEPNLIFLKDTDGDDKADFQEIILHGFGTEDSHHALHAFTYGQDGALYWHEGVFLHTQSETPYGPVRGQDGASYRYEPRTGKLSNYISYRYNNPWGNVFDKWGVHYIGDASDGKNYYATPMMGKIDYPIQHPSIEMFTTTRVRPTAGIEIISSRQFPDDVQGNFLVNNTIGFQGIKQHRIIKKGSGFTAEEVEPLLQSTDPNFRPVDLKFGPDGALYLVDWFNPLIGHMQHSIRDERRDKEHGRIWRITYKGRPLLKSPKFAEQTVPELLENLKIYEDRVRYQTRKELRGKTPDEVFPHLGKWIISLDKKSPDYEHQLLEALWIYQDFDIIQKDLLNRLLRAGDYQARAAATRILIYWQDRIKEAPELLKVQVNDEAPRVRIEAVMALSYSNSDKAAEIALEALNHPTDYYLDYAIKETIKHLKPLWMKGFAQDMNYLADHPAWTSYLLNLTTVKELQALPKGEAVLNAILKHADASSAERLAAIQAQASRSKTTPLTVLVDAIAQPSVDKKSKGGKELVNLLLNWNKAELKSGVDKIIASLVKSSQMDLKGIGYAALMTAEGSDKSAWALASSDTRETEAFVNSTALLPDMAQKLAKYDQVKALVSEKKTDDAVKAAGIRALGTIKPTDQDNIKFISQFIRSGNPYLPQAIETLSALDPKAFTTSAADVNDAILAIARKANDKMRAEPWFEPLIKLGKTVAKQLPKELGDKSIFILESTGTYEVVIEALPSKMLFDKEVVTLPAGRPVTIVFNNPDEMPHNLVIIKEGTLEKVGKAADAMAIEKDGFERNFVPSIPEVLYSTPLLNPGESRRISFTTPKEPGEFTFVCTFPGHWSMMKGTIKVIIADTIK
ncbi:hypothetical protein GVN16_16335 [Emticicia sp. CRIBPO]|uniref:PVC-type heme-binding CxxCH protein n=1 Tax=Emticicia sp. CRIBPO TaxID=2683258 RepID=UPI0014136879|nr:PVC-type heme-binding CxxCH protein [Emticicia sp. CRIBPO]NBA87344.1 hypothetical protein [Emticicia sp. CRIBPO]